MSVILRTWRNSNPGWRLSKQQPPNFRYVCMYNQVTRELESDHLLLAIGASSSELDRAVGSLYVVGLSTYA